MLKNNTKAPDFKLPSTSKENILIKRLDWEICCYLFLPKR